MPQEVQGNPRRFFPWLSLAILWALLVAVGLVMGTGLGGCGGRKAEKRWRVAVDILPYADLVLRVAGDNVEVEVLVPAGASPHAYDLTPRQWAFLEDSDLVVVNGLGLEPWLENLFKKGVGARILQIGEKIPPEMLITVEGDQHHHPDGESSGPVDPHIWLDPQIMSLAAEEVAEAMADLDPERAGYFRERAREFRKDVEELDGEIRGEITSLPRREFVAYHSAWSYFARRYGLVQVGAIEDRPGEEPGAGRLARLADEMRKADTSVVFTEPQLDSRVAEVLAREVGRQVKVVELDPLGRDDDPERDDYLSLMRYNLRKMVEALQVR